MNPSIEGLVVGQEITIIDNKSLQQTQSDEDSSDETKSK